MTFIIAKALRLREANSEDCHHPPFLFLCHAEIPDRFHWHQQNHCIGYGVEEATSVEKFGDINALSWNRLVPDPFSWSTLPYLNYCGSDVEHDQDGHEDSQSPVKEAPSLR